MLGSGDAVVRIDRLDGLLAEQRSALTSSAPQNLTVPVARALDVGHLQVRAVAPEVVWRGAVLSWCFVAGLSLRRGRRCAAPSSRPWAPSFAARCCVPRAYYCCAASEGRGEKKSGSCTIFVCFVARVQTGLSLSAAFLVLENLHFFGRASFLPVNRDSWDRIMLRF